MLAFSGVDDFKSSFDVGNADDFLRHEVNWQYLRAPQVTNATRLEISRECSSPFVATVDQTIKGATLTPKLAAVVA